MHALEDFPRELGGGDQVGGNLVVEEVTRDDVAQGAFGGLQRGFVHHTQLTTQLGDGAGGVDGAQDVFPEAAAHRQDGIVGSDDVLIIGDVFELGAAQMAGNFAEVVAPDAVDFGLSRRFLGEDDFAGDVFHIPITQGDLHREATHQALQVGHAGQSRLAGADKQQLTIEVLGERLGHLLHFVGFVCIGADVLLHLVEYDESERELAIYHQGALNGCDHLVVGDVGDLGKLGLDELSQRRFALCQTGVGLQQGLGQMIGDIEVG